MAGLPNLTPLMPELVLVGLTLAIVIYGVFRGDRSTRAVSWLAVAALAVVAAVLSSLTIEGRTVVWQHFVLDEFGRFMKLLVILGSALAIVMSLRYNRRENITRFEFPILVLFSTLGMMMMISADDLIALYVGLELQSLALYVLAAFARDTVRSSEAGLKYFVLGALASGMLLYGASMIYGFTGTTGFDGLAQTLQTPAGAPVGVIVGLVFLLAGLAFKVSAVPFHMWTPDVYEGAPTPVTAFFSVAPKIAAIALLVRVLIEPFGGLVDEWRQVIVFISLASMIVGALAALWQTNIKRMLAYSSIGHVGYALIGLAAGTPEGVRGIIIYMAIYLATSIGTWCCVLGMRRGGRMVEEIADLSGLSRTNPALALGFGVFMFSMTGVPPLAGFFGKYFVFLAAVNAGLYTLAVVGVLTSVVGAFYYLRIVRLMYFDDAGEPFERSIGREVSLILGASGLFVVLFIVYPGPLLAGAEAAARTLFVG